MPSGQQLSMNEFVCMHLGAGTAHTHTHTYMPICAFVGKFTKAAVPSQFLSALFAFALLATCHLLLPRMWHRAAAVAWQSKRACLFMRFPVFDVHTHT